MHIHGNSQKWAYLLMTWTSASMNKASYSWFGETEGTHCLFHSRLKAYFFQPFSSVISLFLQVDLTVSVNIVSLALCRQVWQIQLA